MRILLCYAALCVACMVPAHAREKKGLPRVGVLFLTPPPPVSAKLTKAFRKGLLAAGAEQQDIVLVGEPEITKALKKDPRKFLRVCGKQVSCLVTVMRKANCDKLLMGRWVNPDAPQLQYAIIDAESKQVVNKGALNVASDSEAMAAARDDFAIIMGLAPQSAPPLPSEITPAPEKPVATAAPKPTPAPTPITPPTEETHLTRASSHSDGWFITSVVLLGVGAGLAGTGGYFAVHGHQLASSVTYGADGTPQTQAVATLNQANSAIGLANVMFYTGAGVGAVGAVLLTLHELGIIGPGAHPDAQTTTTAPGSNGHVSLTPLSGGINVDYSWTF